MVSQVITKRRFTVDEFIRMGEAGILGEDDRIELVEGEVLEMSPIGSRHAACVMRLNHLFGRLGERVIVSAQNPLRLNGMTLVQPDLALLIPRTDFYASGHPGPEDVLLVIEVSDSTLDYDREVKLPFYAAAGIPEVWIVDLPGESVWVHRLLGGTRDASGEASGYREVSRVGKDGRLAPRAFPDLMLGGSQVLG